MDAIIKPECKIEKAKKHHWVPQTYLKGWKVNKSSIYEFKNKGIKVGKPRDIKNILCTNHLYSKKACDLYVLNEENLDKMLNESLKNLDIMLGNYILSDWKDYCNFIDKFNEWTIEKNGVPIGKKHRNKIEHKILYWYDVEIENLLAKQIDNNWKILRTYLDEEILLNKTISKREEYKKEITEFVVVQYFRTPFKKQLIGEADKFFASLERITKGTALEGEITIMERCYYLKSLEIFLKKDVMEDEGKYNYIKQVYAEIYRGKFVFLVDNKGRFITSDNPVSVIIDDSCVNGIYIPLTPQIMLFIARNSKEIDKSHYAIIDVKKIHVSKLNQLIAKFSQKNVYYNKDSIKGLLSNNLSRKDYLEYINSKSSVRGLAL